MMKRSILVLSQFVANSSLILLKLLMHNFPNVEKISIHFMWLLTLRAFFSLGEDGLFLQNPSLARVGCSCSFLKLKTKLDANSLLINVRCLENCSCNSNNYAYDETCQSDSWHGQQEAPSHGAAFCFQFGWNEQIFRSLVAKKVAKSSPLVWSSLKMFRK